MAGTPLCFRAEMSMAISANIWGSSGTAFSETIAEELSRSCKALSVAHFCLFPHSHRSRLCQRGLRYGSYQDSRRSQLFQLSIGACHGISLSMVSANSNRALLKSVSVIDRTLFSVIWDIEGKDQGNVLTIMYSAGSSFISNANLQDRLFVVADE
jgi:hypothetical protein